MAVVAGVEGPLTIEGRLDGPGAPMRVSIRGTYGRAGFQPSGEAVTTGLSPRAVRTHSRARLKQIRSLVNARKTPPEGFGSSSAPVGDRRTSRLLKKAGLTSASAP